MTFSRRTAASRDLEREIRVLLHQQDGDAAVAVDFDDLLEKTLLLLKNNAEIAAFLDGSLPRAEWDAVAARLVNDPAARAELAAAVALLEFANALHGGAGEGAPFMAEEFVFHERVGQSCHIEADITTMTIPNKSNFRINRLLDRYLYF